MFIDYVMSICDRIMARAAEQDPSTTFPLSIRPQSKQQESNPPKETK
jgi:hypothetical protein